MKWTNLLLLAVASAALWQQVKGVVTDDFNIPVTVQVPFGHAEDTLRLHLAAYGAVPYGEVIDSTRVVHYPPDCMCAGKQCNTGCANLRLASRRCRRNLRANEHNVFVFEETGGDIDDGCTRAERAFNAARVGARGVIIVAPPNATNLLAGVNSQDVSAAVETLQFLEHVWMPVGVMENEEGKRLKGYVREAEKAGQVPQVKMDFTHEQRGSVVHVNIWHDTDDDCGVLCHDVHAFFADLAAVAESFTAETPIHFVPRFLYESCTGDDSSSERCKRGCVNGGKYCTLRGSRSELAPGAAVTQENVRQACLYDALRGNAYNTRQFWKYKAYFQNNCKSEDGTFHAECSAEQFRKLQLASPGDVQQRWENCTIPLNNGVMNIPIADVDLAGQEGQKVSNYLQATVVTVLPKPAQSHHYRGELSAVHVMKAACSALTQAQRVKVPTCRRLTQGKCAPGGDGDVECSSLANQESHTTKCVEASTLLGYECTCSPDADGGSKCVDRNECTEFPALCGRLTNPRNACKNLEGSFQCLADLEQQCSAERGWGGCWQGESDGRSYHSCEDLVDQARANLEKGDSAGALSQCNCENIKGCWEGGTGDCRELCPLERCDIETRQCSDDPPLSTGGAVGISFGVIVACGIIAAIGFLIIRRRRNDQDPAQDAVSKYNLPDGTTNGSMHMAPAMHTAPSGRVETYVAGATAASDGDLGSGGIPHGVVVPPPNGANNGSRPPTFGAQNSFGGSLSRDLEMPEAQ